MVLPFILIIHHTSTNLCMITNIHNVNITTIEEVGWKANGLHASYRIQLQQKVQKFEVETIID